MFGNILIVLALLAGVFTTYNYYKVYQGNLEKLQFARYGYHALTMLVITASALLLFYIMDHQYQYKYIFEFSNHELSTGLLISSFFAGQEGSFLLWLLFAVLIGLVLQSFTSKRSDLEPSVMMIYTLTVVFLTIMVNPLLKSPFNYIWAETNYLEFRYINEYIANLPFIKSFIFNDQKSGETFLKIGPELVSVLKLNNIDPSTIVSVGKGLNPLLQNFWMQIHPPILFLGFALTAVPYSFGVAALMKNDYKNWVRQSLPWTIATSLILCLGIMIGAYWAYGVLGWGGYWGWDPVENASLVPWIISAALIHTMIVQKQSQSTQAKWKFVKTNLVLTTLMFVLVIYSTFLTRSGILSESSVHSFVDPGMTVYLFLILYLATFCIIGIGGVFIRRKKLNMFTSPIDNFISRDAGLFYGAAALIASAIVVFVGTSAPLIGQSVEISFYNYMNLPLVIIMALLIGFSLFLRWKVTETSEFITEIRRPIIGSVIFSIFIAFVEELTDILSIIYLFSMVFVIVSNIHLIIKTSRNGFLQLGGHITHIGFAVFLIGVLVSAKLNTEEQVELIKGETQTVLGSEITFTGYSPIENGKKFSFNVEVNDNNNIFTLSPVMYMSDFNNSLMREPDIVEGLLQDFYISPTSFSDDKKQVSSNSTVSLTLNKGEIKKLKDVSIEFIGFDLPEDMMSAMSEGKQFEIGAMLKVTRDGKSYQAKPIMKFYKGKQSYDEFEINDADVKIQLISLAVEGTIKILLNTSSDDKKVQLKPQEILTAEVMIKPFISLVWIGIFIMSVGFVIVTIRRQQEILVDDK